MMDYTDDVAIEVLRAMERGARVYTSNSLASHMRAYIAYPGQPHTKMDYNLVAALEHNEYIQRPDVISTNSLYDWMTLTDKARELLKSVE